MGSERNKDGMRLFLPLAAASIGVIALAGAGTAAIIGWIPAAQSSATLALAVTSMPVDAFSTGRAPTTRAGVDCENCGTIESVTAVRAAGGSSGVGAIAGSAIDGVLGSQVGGGTGRSLATIAGAGGGTYAGDGIEREMHSEVRYRVVVRTDAGGAQTFTEFVGRWKPGDRVRIANGRLVAATPGG